MVAFLISINGERVRTIGASDSDNLSASLNWWGRRPDSSDESLDLYLSSDIRTPAGDYTEEFLKWLIPRRLVKGDEITIRIADVQGIDPPEEREHPDPSVPF